MNKPRRSAFLRNFGPLSLLLALWMAGASAAHSQIIVGNLSNRTSDSGAGSMLGPGGSGIGKLIGFTMGNSNLGLKDVQLQLTITGGLASGITPLVTIWQATSSTSLTIKSGETTPLATLTNPLASNSGSTTSGASLTYTFTVSTPFTLLAHTTYDIVVQESSGTGGFSWMLGASGSQGGVGTGATQFTGSSYNGLYGNGNNPVTYGSVTSNVNWYQVDQVAAVPEPSTMAMFGLGGVLLSFVVRRRILAGV